MAPRARATDGPGSRKRLVTAAVTLLARQGYEASTVNGIASEGAAPMGSFYFHFPGGKEQLAAEAMREAAGRVLEQLRAAAQGAPDAATAIALVIDALAEELVATGFRCGCPLASVALDASARSEPIAAACGEGYRSWRDAIAALLCRHGVGEERAAAVATVTLAAIEGGLLLARTDRDVRPLRQVRDHLVTVINAESAESKERP
jgi:TetR/AcrR family transcriptional repressor of lmrAB and yxaGH operons